MGRGRPVFSRIRQNIIEILYIMGSGYGYDIYKVYREIFPQVTLRSMYYHLRKGVSLGEFEIKEVRNEKGDYSWGGEVQKIYYSLGENANPMGDKRVAKYFNS